MVYLKQKDMKSRSKMHFAKQSGVKGKKQKDIEKRDTRPTWQAMIEDNNVTDLSFLNLSEDQFYPLLGTKHSGIDRLLYENQSHKWIGDKYTGEKKRWQEVKKGRKAKWY